MTRNSWGSDIPVEVSLGGTGRSTNTAYAVTCGGTTTSGAEQSIASVGTANQVLTSNGAGALPTFEDASGGGAGLWVEVGSDSASASSSIDFDSVFSSTYNIYHIVITKFLPVDHGHSFRLKVSNDNGASWESWSKYYGNYNGSYGTIYQDEDAFYGKDAIRLKDNLSNSATQYVNLSMWVYRPADSSVFTGMQWQIHNFADSTSLWNYTGGGYYNIAESLTGIQFYMSSGNISTGHFKVYGIKGS